MQTIFELKGPKDGPIVTIMGGVHGNEFCGVEAIQLLASQLKIQRGTLYLILANELAINQDQREVNLNMNRIFLDEIDPKFKNTYEYQRSLVIRKYLDQSDILLDIHASGPKSLPFIITEANALKYIQNLNFNFILTNIDSFHPGSTDGYMYNRGKVGICIECGYMRDKNSTSIATLAILNMLKSLKMLKGNPTLHQQSKQICKSKLLYKSKTNNFKLAKDFIDFDYVPAKTLIGYDSEQPVVYDEDFYIFFANNQQSKNQECFLLAKKYA